MQHMYIVSAPMIDVLPVGNFHLVLPHLYSNIPGYLDAYKKLSARGDFLMQDSSVFELKRVIYGDLIDFAKQVGATEIVIPEVLRDRKASIEVASEFFGSAAYQSELDAFNYAAAVQGNCYAEVVKHYNWLISRNEVDVVCLAFNYEFDAFGMKNEMRKQAGWNRFSIVRRMMKDCIWDPTKKHHLLGLYNPAELAMYFRIRDENYPPESGFLKSLRSNDSSSCYWHSLYGIQFDVGEGFLYKKIETHVDFNSFFNSRHQLDLFNHNKFLIEGWRVGSGGSLLWPRYRRFAIEEDFEI